MPRELWAGSWVLVEADSIGMGPDPGVLDQGGQNIRLEQEFIDTGTISLLYDLTPW